MARRRLGGQHVTSLLESLPRIASVLRSPVADAIVAMIRAGAGLGDFHETVAKELVEYAVRRGLMGAQEGEELLAEVKEAAKQIRAAKRAAKKVAPKPTAKKAPRAKKIVKPSAPAKVKATKKTTAKKTTTKKTLAKGKKREGSFWAHVVDWKCQWVVCRQIGGRCPNRFFASLRPFGPFSPLAPRIPLRMFGNHSM